MKFKSMAAGALLAASILSLGYAQTVPTQNPTYIPPGTITGTALAAPGDALFNNQNWGTVKLKLTGTNTGVAAVVRCSTAIPGATTINWDNVPLDQTALGRVAAITGDGLYTIKSQGCRQLQFHLTAISTGNIKPEWVGTSGNDQVVALRAEKQMYNAAVTGLVAANSATDIFTIAGNANTTVKLQKLCISGRATAVANADVLLVKRSTADTGGTSTAPVVVPLDSLSNAGQAVLAAYTVNPTLGTGSSTYLGSKQMTLGNLTTGTPSQSPTCWSWGDTNYAQQPTLRGAAQQIGVNLNGVTYSGNLLDVEVSWTEE